MTIKNALAAVAVRDLRASAQGSARLCGRPADSTPMPEVAAWKFSGGGWLQVYASRERIGMGSFTLAVSDLDGQIAALKQRGIDPGRRLGGEKANVIMIKDPDGQRLAFAEAMEPGRAQ